MQSVAYTAVNDVILDIYESHTTEIKRSRLLPILPEARYVRCQSVSTVLAAGRCYATPEVSHPSPAFPEATACGEGGVTAVIRPNAEAS